MFRVGVQFQPLPGSEQAQLDRLVFRLMRQEARNKRHVRGMLLELSSRPGHERRRAHRVTVSNEIVVILESTEGGFSLAQQARLIAAARSTRRTLSISLLDISITGCSLSCDDPDLLRPGTLIRFRILEGDLDLELRGQVVYTTQVVDAAEDA